MSSSNAATAGGGGGGSTSTVSAEIATGRHVFKFNLTAGVGKAVTSGAFSVGGHSWHIQCIPRGCSCAGRQSPSWICFGLHRDHHAADHIIGGGGMVKAHFTLSLLGVDGEPLPSHTRVSSCPRDLSSSTTSYGCHFGRFIRIDGFSSLNLRSDCVRVRCNVTVLLEARDDPVLPSLDLHRELGSILATGVGGDVTFEVGEETIVAHKNVLAARSPVFMAEFFGGMMEEKADVTRVRILGIHARAFEAMLHYIYNDELPEIDDVDKIPLLQHLLVAADRYDIQRLKLICESKLCSSVNASVVATALVLAEQHGCRRLKEACFMFLKCGYNFKALGYHDYNFLLRHCPSFLNEFAERGRL